MLLILLVAGSTACAQTTSLSKRHAPTDPDPETSREVPEHEGNPTLEKHSLIALKVRPPKKLRVNDLITVIVRQQTKFESDGSLNSKKEAKLDSKIDAFINFMEGGIGAALFRRGKPNIKYELKTELKNTADKDREDKFTTRITATIIDVKPNGNLVLEARSSQEFEDERISMALTGICRSVDITPDNTVLSTQLADLMLKVKNHGAVRDGSSRGWLQKILDKTKPF
ncbi:MAG: flagellar basal body L-ring protein FlgH [Phycisphaerae bacterium]|nr:flagellar basal body L-ring protein FlgH [Phycisphaerae bacterium]